MSALSRIRLKELDDLRAENERLQAVLQKAEEFIANWDGEGWGVYSTGRAANAPPTTEPLIVENAVLRSRAEAAERERDELRAKWEPLVTWAAAKEKAEQGLREAHWTEEAIADLSGKGE